MEVLCREKEYAFVHRLLGGDRIELGKPIVPPVIYVHGGPQTGKKLLISSVIKSLQSLNINKKKSSKKLKIRTSLVSCHLGSFGSTSLYEEIWRQISSCDLGELGKENGHIFRWGVQLFWMKNKAVLLKLLSKFIEFNCKLTSKNF